MVESFACLILAMLNIGHSLVSRAVFLGMQKAVEEMLSAIAEYQGLGDAMKLVDAETMRELDQRAIQEEGILRRF